ncbi:hypothetical protein HK101_006834 [Irineochytrium annulatum]|nr:hypothetical protein HK101_006834 [Irineochytrium annulatum]
MGPAPVDASHAGTASPTSPQVAVTVVDHYDSFAELQTTADSALQSPYGLQRQAALQPMTAVAFHVDRSPSFAHARASATLFSSLDNDLEGGALSYQPEAATSVRRGSNSSATWERMKQPSVVASMTPTTLERQARTVIQRIVSDGREGGAPAKFDLVELFKANRIRPLSLTFENKELEKEFKVYQNKDNLPLTTVVYIAECAGVFLLTFQDVLVNGFKIYVVFRVLTGILAGVSIVLGNCLPKDAVYKWMHIWCGWKSFVSLSLYCFGTTYFMVLSERLAFDPGDPNASFDSFIYGTLQFYLFCSLVMNIQEFKWAALTGAVNVIGSWLIHVVVAYSGRFVSFLSDLAAYSSIAVIALITVRDREYRARRIYLMEHLLAKVSNVNPESIRALHVQDVLKRDWSRAVPRRPTVTATKDRFTTTSDRERDAAALIPVKNTWRRRIAIWFWKKALLRWDDRSGEDRYFAWRHASFLAHMRRCLLLQCVADVVTAFLDGISYCTTPGQPHSNSLCGAPGIIIRDIRLLVVPALVIAYGLSFVFPRTPRVMQWIFVAAFIVRGVALSSMAVLIVLWNKTDVSFNLLEGLIVCQIMMASGPAMLPMDMLIIYDSIIAISAVTAAVVPGNLALINFATAMVFITAVACIYNVSFELTEQKFFALWEALSEALPSGTDSSAMQFQEMLANSGKSSGSICLQTGGA